MRPDFKKWDIVAPSTQRSVHRSVNSFRECGLFFPICRRALGLLSSFPVICGFSSSPESCHESWKRLSGEALGPISLLYRAWWQPHLRIQCFGADWQFTPQCWEVVLMPWSLFITEGWSGLRETEVFILVWWIVLYLVTIPAFLFEASSMLLTRLYLYSLPLHI